MISKSIYCIALFILLSFSAINVSAQSREQLKTDSVFQLVKKQFNARHVNLLYDLTGEHLKNELIIDAFRNICLNQLFPLGTIEQANLVSFVNNKIATYKLLFNSGNTLQLLMSLDKSDKVELFLFQPYKAPIGVKTGVVASSNLLKTLTDKQVDSVARPYIQKANTVGLSIGIYKGDKVSTYNYGETTRGNNKLPTPNTLFEIGSITKTFTGTLLAYFANEGIVKLTDPITKYLPDSVKTNKALEAITLQELSNHTSGLPSLPPDFFSHVSDTLNPYKDYNKLMLFSYLKTCTLNNQPGEKYVYSNMAVGLLGVILADISGENFEQMVTDAITNQLKMYNTLQYLPPALKPDFVSVYNEDGRQTLPWDFNALAACGSLKSTVNDLMIYARANMTTTDTKVSKAFALTHQVTFNKDVKIGLAWHIITVNGIEYYFHNGGTYGCSSFLAFNIEKNIAIVILSNSGESVDDVGVGILKKIQY